MKGYSSRVAAPTRFMLGVGIAVNAVALHAQTPPSTPSYQNPPPLIEGARWHHMHVNSTVEDRTQHPPEEP